MEQVHPVIMIFAAIGVATVFCVLGAAFLIATDRFQVVEL